MKKLLAVLLVLCLFVGMMPMAFADDVADTPQANFENTDVLNEGSQDDPGEGEPGPGSYPEIEPDGEDLDTGKGYNADNIQNFDQLQAALKDGLTNIPLGARIDLTDDLTINGSVTITGADDEPGSVFAGKHTLTINGNVTFNYVGIDATIGEVVVNEDSTLTVNDATVASGVEFSGKGKVVVDGETIYPKSDPGEDDDGDDDTQQPPETVPITPIKLSVSFAVKPYWAEGVVTDSNGPKV